MSNQSTHRPAPAVTMIMAILGTAVLICSLVWPHQSRLFYNPSESAPRGFYWLTRTSRYRLGDYVIVQLPNTAARLADSRGYLPDDIPLLKPIRALPGQAVCESGGRVHIEGRLVARALGADASGRPLSAYKQCGVLGDDEFFLMSEATEASFDSRYFGPVSRRAMLGRAIPLWTW